MQIKYDNKAASLYDVISINKLKVQVNVNPKQNKALMSNELQSSSIIEIIKIIQ